MTVRFLKNHLTYKPGDEVDFDEGIAGYLIRVGVATIEQESPEEIEKKLSKKLKTAKKKK